MARSRWTRRILALDPVLDHAEIYRAIGERMGIRDIPGGIAEFRRFKLDYEAATFRYSEPNRRIAQYTIGLFAGWFPAPLRPAVRLGLRGMLDAPMREAFGLAPAPRWVSGAARLGLRAGRGPGRTQAGPRSGTGRARRRPDQV